MNNKIVRVGKITLESYNKLLDAGYTVIITDTSKPRSMYAKYTYIRTVAPGRVIKQTGSLGNVDACKVNHIRGLNE